MRRAADGHCGVLPVWKSLHLPEGKERRVCAQDGGSTNAVDDVAVIRQVFHIMAWRVNTDLCAPTLLLTVEKKKTTKTILLHSITKPCKGLLLQSVSNMLSVRKQDDHFLNFLTGLDTGKKNIVTEQNMLTIPTN